MSEKESKLFSRESFFRLDRPYEMYVDRKAGEVALSSIAVDAKREYVWAFDEEKMLWVYRPSESSEHIDTETGSSLHKATIPKELLKPPGASSDIYHIHPDVLVTELVRHAKPGWHNEEFLRVSNQIPKEDDLHAASVLIQNGYKAFKVVTSSGVTTLEFFPDKLDAEQKEHDIEGITIKSELIYEALKDGFEPAVQRVFEELNRHYRGVFVYKFSLIKADSE